MLSISALKREKQKTRQPFMLVADEVHNFIHGGRFGTLLAESRKYGVTLVLATQGMYQLPFAKDVFSNCPTQITFNVPGEDAKVIEQNWNEEQVQATHITSLSRYEFYCRTFTDDRPVARRIKGRPNIQKRGDEANPTKPIKNSLQQWGRKRKGMVEKINRFLASSA
jgi:TraM recognition site of TraD and TraG